MGSWDVRFDRGKDRFLETKGPPAKSPERNGSRPFATGPLFAGGNPGTRRGLCRYAQQAASVALQAPSSHRGCNADQGRLSCLGAVAISGGRFFLFSTD